MREQASIAREVIALENRAEYLPGKLRFPGQDGVTHPQNLIAPSQCAQLDNSKFADALCEAGQLIVDPHARRAADTDT